MIYNVEISSPAQKQLKKLEPEIQINITKALRALKLTPRPTWLQKACLKF